ncbi:MAG: protein BatD [Verrucomicrobia bacterium]|nr:protein BatD [Verrucomicrobiota bacterium]
MKSLLGVLILVLGIVTIAVAEPSISASLSETVTDLDHPVQLEIKIENARVTRPPTIFANGLSINFAGTSSRTQILNFRASTITTFTYIVTPTKEGTYDIPPVEVSAGGKTYRTSSLTLKVIHNDSNNAGRPGTSDKPYFGELVVPKDSAYVGEQIPIELRFYFNQRIQYQPYPQGQYPIFDGEGFVTKKYPDPSEKQFELNGRPYHVVVYKTALTGVKPGKLELQSATQSFLISTPFGSRSSPGFLDPFEDYQQQVVDVKTNGASIDIKALPAADRPASFSGAVGDFTLATSAQPSKTRTGDPVSMKVEIKGLGNFDRMEQPKLTNIEGWRTYQPSEQTEALDDLGLSAVKTFSYPLVAEKPVSNLPTVEFSYFDPNAEKYVTLKSSPLNIQVDGERLPDLSVPPVSLGAQRAPQPKPQPIPDVLDIQTRPPAPASFLPLTAQPVFWMGQAIPAGGFLLLSFGLWFKNARIASLPHRTLNREKRALWKKIDASDNRPEVLQAAVRILELDIVAQTRSKAGYRKSLEDVIGEQGLPADLRSDVRELLAARGATVYGHLGSEFLTEEERTRIKSVLNRWKAAA